MHPPEGSRLWVYTILRARPERLALRLPLRAMLHAPPAEDALLRLDRPRVESLRVAAVGEPDFQSYRVEAPSVGSVKPSARAVPSSVGEATQSSRALLAAA